MTIMSYFILSPTIMKKAISILGIMLSVLSLIGLTNQAYADTNSVNNEKSTIKTLLEKIKTNQSTIKTNKEAIKTNRKAFEENFESANKYLKTNLSKEEKTKTKTIFETKKKAILYLNQTARTILQSGNNINT